MPDVLDWRYTGNRLRPTQKPVSILKPLIEAFSKPGDTVRDPFCRSGSTLVAAHELGRQFIGTVITLKAWLVAVRRASPMSQAFCPSKGVLTSCHLRL